MKKTKILFAIWAVIVVIIIALLTVMGFILDNRYEKYQALEEKLETSAREYAEDNILLSEEGGEYIVTSLELIEAGYLDNLEVDDNVCTGYVVVQNDGAYQYEAYISCKQYTTKNYDEKKIKIG